MFRSLYPKLIRHDSVFISQINTSCSRSLYPHLVRHVWGPDILTLYVMFRSLYPNLIRHVSVVIS